MCALIANINQFQVALRQVLDNLLPWKASATSPCFSSESKECHSALQITSKPSPQMFITTQPAGISKCGCQFVSLHRNPPAGNSENCYEKIPRLLYNVFNFPVKAPQEMTCNMKTLTAKYCMRYVVVRHKARKIGRWSAGGIIAFEAAEQLPADDERVNRLILIDSLHLYQTWEPSTTDVFFFSGQIQDPSIHELSSEVLHRLYLRWDMQESERSSTWDPTWRPSRDAVAAEQPRQFQWFTIGVASTQTFWRLALLMMSSYLPYRAGTKD